MSSIITPDHSKGIGFGLIFFSSSEAPFSGDKYRLVIESTRFADQHGFSSVWIPERHFTRDGWLYPNPAILLAALARETRQIGLRAGSVVMPLHDPIRVAEEWAMVDNLSGGRVGISFASGWHPNDFVFFPENYTNRNEVMYRGIETVQKLWRGEAIKVKSGDGNLVEIRTYPTPIQAELPIWVTAAGNPKTFAGAGALGANLLTHMYNQTPEELAEKISIYREARAQHGFDPQTGLVSVMLHTFIAESLEAVHKQVQDPFCEYLKSASYLVNAIAYSRGQKVDINSLSEQDLNDYLQFVYERLISTERVLFGTPESCLNLVTQLRAAGANEIACQLDFGVDIDVVLRNMPYLNQLKELSNAAAPAPSHPVLELPHAEHTSLHIHTNGNAPVKEHNGTTRAAQASAPQNRLKDIQQRCQKEVSISAFYNRLRDRGIQLGASFQGIERLWRRDGEALGHIQILETLDRDSSFYQVHPALLDACFQVLVAALPDAAISHDSALYLPTGLQSFQVHQRPGKQVWSHAVLKSSSEHAQAAFEGDVYILDDEGQILIEASGLQLQRSEPVAATEEQSQLNDWLYELRWEPAPQTQAAASTATQAGRWLIFMDQAGVGQKLVDLLEAHGNTVCTVVAADTYQRLAPHHYQLNPAQAEDVQHVIQDQLKSASLRGIVHLWNLDATAVEQTSAASLEADQVTGVSSVLNVIKALINAGTTETTRLWLATRGAQAVSAKPEPLAIAQSPVWGLGKTCAMEHPEFWGGLIDLDPQESLENTAQQLLNAISGEHGEDQLAFRQGQRYVARLVRSQDWQKKNLTVRTDSSYLITGGLWGLGLEVARWLAQKGAQHLILLGRTVLPAREHWDQVQDGSRLARQIAGIRELEKLGSHVHYAAVDVADEERLAAFLQDFQRQGYPAIRGVIHAASVWQDTQGRSLVGPLANLDITALETVFRPKVRGGWLLYTLLKGTTLDFFVSFSSGASLIGSAAQGNYAAAGAFLDALSHHLRALGLPALSIDWGAVSETGFGATPEGLRVHEYWETHGIQRITPRHVLEALELLIPQAAAQVGVMKLDWHLLQQFYAQIAQLPLVRNLVEAPTSNQTHAGVTLSGKSAIIQTILGANQGERQQLMEGYLCEQVSGVLRVPASRLDVLQPLTALGLDSLMAIELKNRLEHELSVRIPIVTFLQGPSIAQFARQLLDQLATADSAAPPETPEQGQAADKQVALVNQGDAAQLLTQLDQLSDEEVDSLLNRMLQEEELNL
ncbi:MupA/Atu3671 family FMN-dependent luciferase-like monooxygenase [Ktedonosporobacter rubrisoli]|uniref:MupA/Atu3671 family FMN-dependent luciferase-like monooxygenase n=1 Tax=Ktedonosporobacter rubrisoli TaxID=2509675 RepID=UPI001A917ED3|nr:MupA/Atu3671 family FMN-dependent luciferase-like monooxygenase [Ktedonosporobacter rubrisoli]